MITFQIKTSQPAVFHVDSECYGQIMTANVTQVSSLTTSTILLTPPSSRSFTSGQKQTIHPVCLSNSSRRETAEHRTSWFDRWFRERKKTYLLSSCFCYFVPAKLSLGNQIQGIRNICTSHRKTRRGSFPIDTHLASTTSQSFFKKLESS